MKIEGMEPVEILQKLYELKTANQFCNLEGTDDESAPNGIATDKVAKPKEFTKHIRQLITHSQFKQYKLSAQDVIVIADLWHYHLEFTGRTSGWSSICLSAKIDTYKVSDCLDYITSLLERNIISFDEKITGNYYLNPMILQSAEYTLSKEFTLRIMGRDLMADLELCLKDVWQDNQDFLHDLRLIFDLAYDSFAELGHRFSQLEYPILSTCLNLLKDRIISAHNSLGIKALALRYGLSENHIYIILVTLYHQLHRDDRITEPDLILSLAPDPRERWLLLKQLNDDSLLISEGLICKEPQYHKAQVCSLGISEEFLAMLGCRAKTAAKSNNKGLSPYFEKCQTKQTLDNLILPEGDKQLLTVIINKCRTDKSNELSKWGFVSDKDMTKQGLVILLYGAPGTGKTYTAGAIANELQRELVMLNVPELRNKYYGETEKQIKKAFTEMREMAVQEVNPPLFLLNEADQLIHNRIDNSSTCGTIENTIQSIILEELETFPGILILTTNLESNMDEAFFRRFDLKLKFNLPDLDSRYRLWKMYLRTEIPGAGDIDIDRLARRYQFSGAQIAMVVHNACCEAVRRTGINKRLYLDDLLKYAELEHPWSNGISKSIGF